MTDVENLLMNYIRNSLENLQHEGVGYIGQEITGRIFYAVDGREFEIALRERRQTQMRVKLEDGAYMPTRAHDTERGD